MKSKTHLSGIHFGSDLPRWGCLPHPVEENHAKMLTNVAAASEVIDLNIHKEKLKILEYDTARSSQITLKKLYILEQYH